MRLVPSKWSDFQHYRDRSPPWIKLHRRLLDDVAIARLPVEARAIVWMLWLLAAESPTDNPCIEGEMPDLAMRLRLSESEVSTGVQALVASGLFTDASNTLASASSAQATATRSPSPSPSLSLSPSRKRAVPREAERPDSVAENIWLDWLEARRKKGAGKPTETALAGVVREAATAGISLEDAIRESAERSWISFRADWHASAAVSNGKPVKKMEHMRGLPLGTPSCSCEECARSRARNA